MDATTYSDRNYVVIDFSECCNSHVDLERDSWECMFPGYPGSSSRSPDADRDAQETLISALVSKMRMACSSLIGTFSVV